MDLASCKPLWAVKGGLNNYGGDLFDEVKVCMVTIGDLTLIIMGVASFDEVKVCMVTIGT